jgi:ectoine hydroxylase-related dioxygenase (phytanoyl-CoA dioxygenase family)
MNTYDQQGFLTNLDVLGPEFLAMYDEIMEADAKQDLSRGFRTKANVLYPSVHAFTKSQKVLEIAREILRTNDIHCWDSMVWVKRAGVQQRVSPHQDGTYWNFAPKHRAFTMWVPLQPVSTYNGSIEYAAGSHRIGQLRHEDMPASDNLLVRGQTVTAEFAFEPLVDMSFGSATIHHPFCVHRSGSNSTLVDRRALNFMFVSYECKPIIDSPMEWTVCISGDHDPEHWRASPEPKTNIEDNEVAWRLAHAAQRSNYLRMNNAPDVLS